LKHADRLTPRERYYIEGFAYSNRSDSIAKSMDAYQKCIELDPGHQACRHNLGLQLLELGRPEEAGTHYEELVRRGTTNPTSFENLASSYLARGEIDRALRTLATFLSRNPDSSAGHDSLGFALVMAGRYEDAIASYSRAMLLNPSDSLPPFGRVLAQILSEKWEAANEGARALAAGPEDTRKWFGNQQLSILALYRGRSGEALAAAERAASAYRTPGVRTAVSRRNLANILLARSQAALALAHVEQARIESRNSPQEAMILVTAAQVLARMNRRPEAEDVIADLGAKSEALAPNRDARRVHLARGLVALASRDVGMAIGELEKAQATLSARGPAPGGQSLHVPIWFNLAEAYFAAGRDQDAARLFQRVADAGYERYAWPVEYVRSFYFLGRIHEKNSDAAKARDAYRRFLGYWKDGDLDRDRIAEVAQKLR